MAGPRRRAREIALQILHQGDAGGEPELDPDTAIVRYFTHLADDDSDGDAASVPKADRDFVERLVRGVAAHRAEIDELLTNLSRNWRVERIAIVERNVIRIALFELRWSEGTPVNVVLNEAIELAKRYGTSEGAAFVNGLLDRAVGELNVRG
jgi:transcription antitermination protein NusB